jgi:leader peptidase (prepilin peptidase)/N-methyltransferase
MWVYIWLPATFVIGACVGSLVNVCVYRLPTERSLFWPGSRCGRCLHPIRWYDNIPLLSYWVLRGRCRRCGECFSIRYFVVELLTALGYAGLFYLVIVRNALGITYLGQLHLGWDLALGRVPIQAWAVWLHLALLFTFLLIVSLCDLDDMEIPMGVTVTGTLVGLVLAVLFPWPFPDFLARPVPRGLPPAPGLYAWPVWYPLPAGLAPLSWKLGLYTGLAGAAAGAVALRGIRFVFSRARGIEGLGLGDADLMMMAGAFIGWQPVLTALFVAVLPGLFFGLVTVFRKGDHPLPFGPSLAAGVLITVFAWPSLGRKSWEFYSNPMLLGFTVGMGAILLLVAAVLLRLIRGVPAEKAAP